ncbi:uncharacterized protein PG998_013682 [Apiospora kogelbergensis]|uniref:Uncharacterized protein n=1 Tax=Apiospora kogelbergensis TaxID=1337665 RepID=A0AAW0R0P2_9PEZI
MPSAKESSPGASNGALPALPPNVSIFTPAETRTAKALLNGRLFTRLTVSVKTEPAQLAKTLESHGAYCTPHRNVVLIFDDGEDSEAVGDAHHEHFRLVCLALKDNDISLDVAGCIFDVANVVQAGFQLDELKSGSVLVIDLMGGGDDDDDSDDDDDAGLEALLAKGNGSGATMS